MMKQSVAVGMIYSATIVSSFQDDHYEHPYPSYPGYGPPFRCVFTPESQLGLFQCLTPGTAICRDGHAFGIDAHDGNVKLWDPHGKVVYWEFPNAKKFCVGEKIIDPYLTDFHAHPWYDDVETPYLFVVYDGGDSSASLRCSGVGEEDKDAVLKIVDYSDRIATGGDPIVKFKKGPGYENALWWIDAFGRTGQGYGCDWFLDTAATPTPSEPSTRQVESVELSLSGFSSLDDVETAVAESAELQRSYLESQGLVIEDLVVENVIVTSSTPGRRLGSPGSSVTYDVLFELIIVTIVAGNAQDILNEAFQDPAFQMFLESSNQVVYDGLVIATEAVSTGTEIELDFAGLCVNLGQYDGDWQQRGQNITGKEDSAKEGRAVSLSGNGLVVVSSAPGFLNNVVNDPTPNILPYVRVHAFNKTSGIWIQKGQDITETGPQTSNFGVGLELSDDGNTVVIAAASAGAQIYEYDEIGGNWTQKGSDVRIPGVVTTIRDVSMSKDGTTVAIADFIATNSSVYVYKFSDTQGDWMLKGDAIVSPISGFFFSGDRFGDNFDLSDDGNIIAIGAPSRDPGGAAEIFEFDGSEWSQKGQTLADAGTTDNEYGYQSALSSKGDIYATLSEDDEVGEDTGFVQVFEFNEAQALWIQKGQRLLPDDIGYTETMQLALSGCGNVLAISTPYENETGGRSNDGIVTVWAYDFDQALWIQVGSTIRGETAAFLGIGLSISNDGKIFALGTTESSSGYGGCSDPGCPGPGRTQIFGLSMPEEPIA